MESEIVITLLDAVEEDTNGDAVNLSGGPKAVFIQSDDFGGGTVTVQVSVDSGTTWHTAKQKDGTTNMTATGNAALVMWEYPPGVQLRAILGSSTTPDPLSVYLVGQT
jgi:hypothetical protein